MSLLRSVISGVLIGQQGWSIGLNHTTSNNSPTDANMADFAQAVYASFLTRVWNPAAGWKTHMVVASSVQKCTLYHYPADTGPADKVGTSTGAAVNATGTADFKPAQVSLVASLLSNVPGRNNRGRIYMPMQVDPMTSSLTVGSTTTDTLATNLALWLSDIDAIPFGVNLGAVITSHRDSAPTVRTVRVDNVPDTQRRRRDKVAITHSGVGTVT